MKTKLVALRNFKITELSYIRQVGFEGFPFVAQATIDTKEYPAFNKDTCNIIFLDIDGVLNRVYLFRAMVSLDAVCPDLEKKVVDYAYEELKSNIKKDTRDFVELALLSILTELQATHKNLYFVIHSSWRSYYTLGELSKILSPLRIIGVVEEGYKPRAIINWWKQFISPQLTEFSQRVVVLDDDIISDRERPYHKSYNYPLLEESESNKALIDSLIIIDDFYGLRESDLRVPALMEPSQ